MATEDVLLEDLGVKLLRLGIEARESLLGVGDEDAAVAGALHCAKDTRTGRCAAKTDVEVAFERTGSVLVVEGLGELDCAVRFGDALVFVGETKLCESTTGAEKAGCVGYNFN